MNHASSSPIDAEAYRYLKHHALLESARKRAYEHLDQIWLQLNRLITRELGADLLKSNWLEVISPQPEMITGLRWSTSSLQGGVTLEIADVRRWTNISGERVVFTISSQRTATRQHLKRVLTPQRLTLAFKLGDQMSKSILSYSPESTRVISVALPLMLGDPRHEAASILESIAVIWELMEGDPAAESEVTEPLLSTAPHESESRPVTHSEAVYPQSPPPAMPDEHAASPSPKALQAAPPRDVISSPPRGVSPTPQTASNLPTPRYASAAPPPHVHQQRSSRATSQPPAQPFPPTLPPVPAPLDDVHTLRSDTAHALSTNTTTLSTMSPHEQRTPPQPHQPSPDSLDLSHPSLEISSDLSKEEMIQAIQEQVRQRPGRLIRGGERNAAPVTSEPPRFIPRPLSEQEARVQPAPSQPSQQNSERPILDEGRVHPPSVEVETLSLVANENTHPHPSETSQEIRPLSIESLPDDEVSPPSYIKSLSQRLVTDDHQINVDGDSPQAIQGLDIQGDDVSEQHSTSDTTQQSEVSEGEPPQKLTLESLTELLERISLTPWRINTYEGGQGQILWLQNGSHLDYNPSGELILGGENQDETRVRLSHVGIEV